MCVAGTLAVALLVPAAFAIQPVESNQLGSQPKLSRAFIAPELAIQTDLEPTAQLASGHVLQKAGAAQFLQRTGGSWEVRWDRRTDRPNLVQGSGIALLPGRGNSLSRDNLGLTAGQAIDLATVEARLREFMSDNKDFLQTPGLEFRIAPDSSVPYGNGDTHWFIEFEQYANGVRVDRARLFFRISHGNIVQFGEELVAPVAINTQPSVSRTDAFRAAWSELGFPPGTAVTETVDAGELRVLPVLPAGDQPAETYLGPKGAGYEHRLAWRFVFRVNGDNTTYEVLFDAHRNAIIAVRNLMVNADAKVTGGIYPTTNSDPEIVVPMPFLAVTNGGPKITDALGMYDYSGGTATTTLDGKYFRMRDGCGSISLANSTDGNLNLGTSGGTDCTTPGVGGAGNTHASRTGFYHLTNINRKAATFHPKNWWLASTVTANMNVDDICNAGWDGFSLHFFKSGAGCSNTGELAAVFLHEWGHGMDTNTGGTAEEYGSGEAVGDTFAFLETKNSCIGDNFSPGRPCYNCGTCTGVRDVKPFSTRGTATIAKPSTITSATGAACARFECPYFHQGIFPYQGPMGYEGHCESYIASSANWDLTQALIDQYGPEQGWHEMDRIWYGSLVPSKSAYQVVSGGQCNVNAVVNGCGSDNWYTVFLAADDNDGNLANGTPNACLIWDAFEAHGIACGTRPACSVVTGYAVGGSVSGLTGSGLVLSLNGTTSLPVSGNGSFTFPGTLATGTQYTVTVGTQPSAPAQTCTVANGSGTIGVSPVTNVAVTCSGSPPTAYTVGGNVSGLGGSGLVLSLNGTSSLPVSGNGPFTFPGTLPTGTQYAVTVGTQPSAPAQTCTVANGSGTIGASNVTNVVVTCAVASYTVGGMASGLAGTGLKLKLNNGANLPISTNGAFAFATRLASGDSYTVSVSAQPTAPAQVCAIDHGSGTVGASNVTDVAVTCAVPPPPTYTVGGSVSGLVGSGLILSLNGTANLPVAANGSFTFPAGFTSGTAYSVTVSAQPSSPAQTCTLANASGSIGASNVTNVLVSCAVDVRDVIYADGFEITFPRRH